MIIRAGLALVLLLCCGCFNIDLYAPHGMDVTLLPSDEPVEVERRWRTWYVAWGLTHVDNTMPDEYIQRENLTEVRLITEDNVPDAFHGLLYNVLIPIGLVPQTLVLQGNRPPDDPSAESAKDVQAKTVPRPR